MSVAFLTTMPGWLFGSSVVAVKAAFGADLTASPTTWVFTDITADVRQAGGKGITITHGRADEASQAQPATGSLELDNTSGAYTAYNVASSHWPGVRRNTPIKVVIDLGDGNGEHVRIFGYATGWVPSWDISGALPIVTLSFSGILRRLQQGKGAPRSAIRRGFDSGPNTPLAYWPLEDGTAATSGASAVAGVAPLTAQTGASQAALVKFGTGTGRSQPASTGYEVLAVASDPMASLGAGGSLYGTVPPGTNTTIGWVGCLIGRCWAFDVGTDIVLARWTTLTGTWVRFELLNLASNGGFVLNGFDTVGTKTLLVTASGTSVDLNFFRVQALQVGGNITFDLRIARAFSAGGATFIASNTVAGTLGWVNTVAFNPTNVITPSNPVVGSVNQTNDLVVGHAAVYQSTVINGGAYNPVSTVSSHDGLGITPWAGNLYEQPHTRLARLCAEEGVPLDFTDILSLVDGTFESGLNWTATNGTVARSSTFAHTGTWSAVLVVTGTPLLTFFRPNTRVRVNEGTQYRLTFWAFATTITTNVNTVIDWYDGSGTNFSSTFQPFTLPANTWTKFDVTYTAPTGTVTANYGPSLTASPATGTTVYFDDIDLHSTIGSPVSMGPQPTATFIDLIREVETADLGVLADGFTAGLSYVTGQNRLNPTVALTADMSLNQLADFTPVDDDQRTRNQWSVSRTNGSTPAVYQDLTGPLGANAIGDYKDSLTVSVSDDTVLHDYASWGVHVGTNEGFRYPNLNLNLVASPLLAASWLACALQDRLDATNPTAVAPQHPTGTISVLFEGWTEFLSPFDWAVGANCSPANPWNILVLAADTGDTGAFLGRLDTDGTTVRATVSIGGTSMVVDTPSGPVWTTTADDYPLLLAVAGTTATATAVAAFLADTFTRTVSSSFGTTDTGQTYTTSGGAAADYGVNGSRGTMALTSTGVERTAVLANVGPAVDVTVFILPTVVAVGAQFEHKVRVRHNGSTWYETNVQYQTTGFISLYLVQGVTVLSALANVLAYGAGTMLGVRMRAVGSTIQQKLWDASGAEPAGWTASVTDTTYAGAATDNLMLAADRITSNTNAGLVVLWDNLTVNNYQTFTVTGVARALPAGSAVNPAQPAILAF